MCVVFVVSFLSTFPFFETAGLGNFAAFAALNDLPARMIGPIRMRTGGIRNLRLYFTDFDDLVGLWRLVSPLMRRMKDWLTIHRQQVSSTLALV